MCDDKEKLLEEAKRAQAEMRRLEAKVAELAELKDWVEQQVEHVRAEEQRLCAERVREAKEHERRLAQQLLQEWQKDERKQCEDRIRQAREDERAHSAQELGKMQVEMEALREELEREMACANEDVRSSLRQAKRALEEKEGEMRDVEAQVQAWAENEIREKQSQERLACEQKLEAQRQSDRLWYQDEVSCACSKRACGLWVGSRLHCSSAPIRCRDPPIAHAQKLIASIRVAPAQVKLRSDSCGVRRVNQVQRARREERHKADEDIRRLRDDMEALREGLTRERDEEQQGRHSAEQQVAEAESRMRAAQEEAKAAQGRIRELEQLERASEQRHAKLLSQQEHLVRVADDARHDAQDLRLKLSEVERAERALARTLAQAHEECERRESRHHAVVLDLEEQVHAPCPD